MADFQRLAVPGCPAVALDGARLPARLIRTLAKVVRSRTAAGLILVKPARALPRVTAGTPFAFIHLAQMWHAHGSEGGRSPAYRVARTANRSDRWSTSGPRGDGASSTSHPSLVCAAAAGNSLGAGLSSAGRVTLPPPRRRALGLRGVPDRFGHIPPLRFDSACCASCRFSAGYLPGVAVGGLRPYRCVGSGESGPLPS